MSQALLAFIALELTRAVLTEGMYQSTNRIPVLHPQLTILIVELVRVLIVVVMLFKNSSRLSLSNIQNMAIQSLLWFINNCIYFAALRHASVATMSILMQLRLPITGVLHHFLVKKQENQLVWIALTVIYVGIVLTQWTSDFSIGDIWTVFLCVIMSILSSIASIVSESTMKTLAMPFWDQQFRVCVLGAASSAIFLGVSKGVYVNIDSLNYTSVAMTFGSTLAAAGGGLFTGIVVRSLNSVVKLIAQAAAAICTTALVYLLFGTFKATLELFTAGSLLLIGGTVLYGLEASTNPAYDKIKRIYKQKDFNKKKK